PAHRPARLACGDVQGKVAALFARVQAAQRKSGAFDVSAPPPAPRGDRAAGRGLGRHVCVMLQFKQPH
uniref:Uncharacterized protein n=1 Tax=Varanus komodoensis TaxID=61221 RepID=A0A8D2JGJ8_VARKO